MFVILKKSTNPKIAVAIAGDKIGKSSANKTKFLPLKLYSAIPRAAGKAKQIANTVTTKAINKLLSNAVEIPEDEANK